MQTLTDLSLMDHLHDSEVTAFVWDNSDPSERCIRLSLTAPSDIEYAAWRGCSLTIIMSDVVLCRLLGYGHQIGKNRIDSFRQGVTTEFKRECYRLRQSGVSIPPLAFTLVFGDGSTLELVCEKVAAEVTNS